jgi:hypothetical protein
VGGDGARVVVGRVWLLRTPGAYEGAVKPDLPPGSDGFDGAQTLQVRKKVEGHSFGKIGALFPAASTVGVCFFLQGHSQFSHGTVPLSSLPIVRRLHDRPH